MSVSRNELQDIVEVVSRELGRPIAIDDRDFHLLAHTEHPDDVDPIRLLSIMRRPYPAELTRWLDGHGLRTAAGPVVLAANSELGAERRICIPVRFRGTLFGYLWLIDRERSLSAADMDRAEDAAEEAARVLYRQRIDVLGRRATERRFVRGLLSPDPAQRREVLADMADDVAFPVAAPAVALVAELPKEADSADGVAMEAEAVLSSVARQLSSRHTLALVTSRHGVLIASLSDSRVRVNGLGWLAEALRDELMEAFGSDPVDIVGVGGEVDHLERIHDSYQDALRALRVASRLGGFRGTVHWDELGIYRTLAAADLDLADRLAIPAGILAMLGDERLHPLLKTLETYLDLAGDARLTATQLGLHRTSLYQRLRRIEEVADVNLRDGGERLELHLGLKLARLRGERWDHGGGAES